MFNDVVPLKQELPRLPHVEILKHDEPITEHNSMMCQHSLVSLPHYHRNLHPTMSHHKHKHHNHKTHTTK